MWSFAASTADTSGGVSAIAPLRTWSMVGEPGDRRHPGDPGGAFLRVERAKQLVDQLAIPRRGCRGENRCFDVLEEISDVVCEGSHVVGVGHDQRWPKKRFDRHAALLRDGDRIVL